MNFVFFVVNSYVLFYPHQMRKNQKNMHEAIEIHVRGLLEDKLPIPESHSFAEYVAVQ